MGERGGGRYAFRHLRATSVIMSHHSKAKLLKHAVDGMIDQPARKVNTITSACTCQHVGGKEADGERGGQVGETEAGRQVGLHVWQLGARASWAVEIAQTRARARSEHATDDAIGPRNQEC